MKSIDITRKLDVVARIYFDLKKQCVIFTQGSGDLEILVEGGTIMDNARIKKLIDGGILVFHHMAWGRGYVSRRSSGYVEKYNGRFGIGVKLHSPCFYSTVYHYVDYYIFPGITLEDVKKLEDDYDWSDYHDFMAKIGVEGCEIEMWSIFCDIAEVIGVKVVKEVES